MTCMQVVTVCKKDRKREKERGRKNEGDFEVSGTERRYIYVWSVVCVRLRVLEEQKGEFTRLIEERRQELFVLTEAMQWLPTRECQKC